MSKQQAKQQRKPNFSEKEKLLLLSEWEKRQDVLRPKFSAKITSQDKHNAWQEIADVLNAQFPSVRREVVDIQKKWQNMNSKMKEEASKQRKESATTGGGPSPPELTAIDQRLMAILGETSPTIIGIDGGIDSFDLEDQSAVAIVDGHVASTPVERCQDGDQISADGTHYQSTTRPKKRTRSEVNDDEYGKLLVLEQKRSEAETRRALVAIEKLELEKQLIALQIAALQQTLENQ